MSNAEDGYGVKSGYTYGYYRRLSPSWLRMATTIHSVTPPEERPLRYFELGFGQGVSLNVHAAANDCEFWGNDYNPDHVQFAKRLAEASTASIHLLNLSFTELADCKNLPKFDIIVAHGIWSWISDASRAAILRFVDISLAPGGLFYLSYNSLPGSASGVALQKLVRALTRSMDDSLSETERFSRARDCLKGLENAPSSHFDHYPKAKDRLLAILGASSAYQLHEYTVSSWDPMLLSDVAGLIQHIGLKYVGSATPELQGHSSQSFLFNDGENTRGSVETLSPILLETIGDFEVDRQFRADLFVRDPVLLGRKERNRRLYGQQFALTTHPDEIEEFANDEKLSDDTRLCGRVLKRICSHLPEVATVNDISAYMPEVSPDCILRSFLQCASSGVLHPALANRGDKMLTRARRLNDCVLLDKVRVGNNRIAASPITGSGVPKFLRVPEYERVIAEGGGTPSGLIEEVRRQVPIVLKNCSAIEIVKLTSTYIERARIASSLEI